MKIPRPLYTLAPLLLLATAAVAQDDLPDLTAVPDATGRPESSSSAEPTSTPTSEAASTTADAPQQTETNDGGFQPPTDLPTIAGALNPTVGVPYTANAPYMQKSSLPEGTVFICVGAALGFLGACILAWRGMVAWSLHRSVKRAGVGQTYVGESKPSLRGPSGGIYSGLPGDSTLSLNKPNLLNKKHLSATPSTFSANKGRAPSSLFFSPTAGTGHPSQNRSSSYLPAGYYAAGASTTASGAPTTQIGAGASTSSLGPSAAGYNRARSIGPSPPGSPALPPSRGYDRPPPSRGSNFDGYSRSSMVGNLGGERGRSMYERPSTSSLNLSVQPTEGRTPSAYLEDLFENHGSGPRERY